MISPEMAVDIVSPYPPTMQDLEKKVAELEGQLSSLNNSLDFYRTNLDALEAKRQRLKDFVISNLENDSDFEDVAQDIAAIMAFDLTKEYYFDVTVRFTGVIEGSPGQDLEDFIENMHFDMSDRYSDIELSVDDITVDSVDIQET